MIERRDFLILGIALGSTPYLSAKEIQNPKYTVEKVRDIIGEVQEHMFPIGTKLPSAKEMNVTQFLLETITHKSFDKDIREFVIEGAKELQLRTKGTFSQMTISEKEKALRKYEETNYGSSWLSRIMTLTMEGMFGDPVYGGNVKENGWKSLQSFGGQPRPKGRYLDV